MHSAVPVTEIFTEFRLLPSPDSLNDTVIEFEVTLVTLAKLKCGLTANADDASSAIVSATVAMATTPIGRTRRVVPFMVHPPRCDGPSGRHAVATLTG